MRRIKVIGPRSTVIVNEGGPLSTRLCQRYQFSDGEATVFFASNVSYPFDGEIRINQQPNSNK